MMWRYFLASLCFPVGLFAQEAKVDTTQVDEVLIKEKRFAIPFGQYNRQMDVLTADDLKRLPVQSVQEALAWIGGVDLRQRGPFGTQADVSVQGGSFDQTLILLNGQKISDSQTGHHSLNIPIPLIAVERIEVLQGAAARVYGINALTGAINIVTKTGRADCLTIQTQIGSSLSKRDPDDGKGWYNGAQLETFFAQQSNKVRHVAAIAGMYTNGQRYNSAAQHYKLWYAADVGDVDRSHISWYAGHIFNEFGANGFYAAPIDKESEEAVKTSLIGFNYSKRMNNLLLKPSVSYRQNADDYRFYRQDWSKSRSQHKTQTLSTDIQATWQLGEVDLGFGWESRFEKISSSNIGQHERYNHGAFMEAKYSPIPQLNTNFGAYVNYNSVYGWDVYPGVDIGYSFAKKWRWSVAFNTAQRLPSFTDLYLQQAPANIGNSQLKTERSLQYETALHFHSTIGRITMRYFNQNIDQFIDWIRADVSEPYQAQNFGEIHMQGFGLRLENQWTFLGINQIGYKVFYNYLNPKQMPVSDVYTSKYVLENLKHQLGLHIFGQMGAWSSSFNTRVMQRQLQASYHITDFKIARSWKKWQLSGQVNNIFGTAYTEIGAIPLPSRWSMLSIQYNIK